MELTLKHFLVFIGSTFFCALTFAVIAGKVSAAFGVTGKKMYGHCILSALLTSVAAFFSLFLTTDPFLIFWMFGLLFLVGGIFHAFFIDRRYAKANDGFSFRVLLAGFILGMAIISFSVVVFSALQYFLLESPFMFYPVLMSVLLFFVPLLTWYSFLAAYAIPEKQFPVWQYPLHNTPAYPSDISRERMLVVGLELAKKESDEQKTYFRAKVPETMKLGDFIYHFINDYNELHPTTSIAYADDALEPASWIFYTKRKWYQGQKILNPLFSVRENEVVENTVIVCERVPEVQQTSNSLKRSYHEG
jgi:hypothetical protein